MSYADFDNFEACTDEAPKGTYILAKQLRQLIGDTADQLIRELRQLGLKADTCDGIRAVEVAIYQYIKDSNNDATVFPTAESFGNALGGPARERVLAQAARDMAFLATAGGAA
ncbi:hypothetical protein BRM42_01845 [Xanthomonas oryzae pv. oryzae]|nr:hypothetical protein BRM42_01845 [Xanthomonas oryzae pv. oryzae]